MISFALTEDQDIARAAAAELRQGRGAPAARAADENGAFPEALLERAWSLGLVQSAAGGEMTEQPSVLNALVIEEIAHGDAALAVALAAPLGFVKAIAENGTPAQKRAYLPAFAGDAPRFAAIASVDAGWFRGEGRGTRAARRSGGWRLDGAKALVPLAARCEYFLVTAETRGRPGRLRDRRFAPGLGVEAAQGTLGLRALAMADIALDGVVVAEDGAAAGWPAPHRRSQPRGAQRHSQRPCAGGL